MLAEPPIHGVASLLLKRAIGSVVVSARGDHQCPGALGFGVEGGEGLGEGEARAPEVDRVGIGGLCANL